MGKLEKEARSRRRNANIQRIVLGTIKAAGVLSVALLAPNALRMLELFEGGRTRKKDPKYVVQSTFGRLVQKGYITLDTYRGKKVARLTKKGRQALALFEAREYKLKKPRRWDKRWRVVIFDIPENRRGSRDLFRKTLRAAGFVQLQQSVWVYPYDCEDLIILLKADLKVGRGIVYMIVEKIENDKWLRERFSL